MFMGKFYKCIDTETGDKFSHEVIPNKTVCLQAKEEGGNADWINAKVHFDNVGMAYLALLEASTIMRASTKPIKTNQIVCNAS
jgi:hypothetical protein